MQDLSKKRTWLTKFKGTHRRLISKSSSEASYSSGSGSDSGIEIRRKKRPNSLRRIRRFRTLNRTASLPIAISGCVCRQVTMHSFKHEMERSALKNYCEKWFCSETFEFLDWMCHDSPSVERNENIYEKYLRTDILNLSASTNKIIQTGWLETGKLETVLAAQSRILDRVATEMEELFLTVLGEMRASSHCYCE